MSVAGDPAPAPRAAPYGAHASSGLLKALIGFTRNAKPTRGGRLLTSPARRLITTLAAGPIDIETYGAKMRLYPRDNLADKRVLIRPQLFDPQEREALADIMHDRFAFIDAGANTGMYSLFVAARAGSASHILAIEPQPVIKERLNFNIAVNNFVQITHADIALAAGEGEAKLTVSSANRGQSQIAVGEDASSGGDASRPGVVTVPTIGLFELMDYRGMTRPDALKIDIEGAEDQVMPAFFERCPPERLPRMIIMETLSTTWSVDCVQLAKDKGYEARGQNRRNIILTRA